MSWSGETFEEFSARWTKEKRLADYPPSDYCRSFMEDVPVPTDVKDWFLKHQRIWTQALIDCGLQYIVFWGSALHRASVEEAFNITYDASAKWISGAELLSRWGITARELVSGYISFPVYFWLRETKSPQAINDKISSYFDIMEFQQDPHKWIMIDNKPVPNIWFSVPHLWWCRLEDIEFYEKLEHVKAIRTGKDSNVVKNAATLEVTLDWLSVTEVKARWSVSNHKLEELVRDKGLPSYGLSTEGIYAIHPDSPTTGGFLFLSYTFGDRLFKLTDVKKFQKDHHLKRKKTRTPKERDIERIAKLIPKAKKRSRNIIDAKLAEVIHWALSKPRPFLGDEDEYDWVLYLVPDHTGQFEGPHAASWVWQRIRDIQKKERGRPRKK